MTDAEYEEECSRPGCTHFAGVHTDGGCNGVHVYEDGDYPCKCTGFVRTPSVTQTIGAQQFAEQSDG